MIQDLLVRPRRDAGFTLLELLVVLLILGVAAGAVVLGLPDPRAGALEREAVRLAAQLEAARSAARATGQTRHWRPTASGYTWEPSMAADAQHWLEPDTQVQVLEPAGADRLVLGPEPILPPQRLRLTLGDLRADIASDGLRPFARVAAPPTAPP
ncbi:prepilin-type N-terminal cleavage/methylation domain-containing protein [Aquabacterium sp. A08]|uniref:prepilin-type N-terminal cleavage/methylation domain-containing protein n=1 Tax=Aquabacterium sp. A08 TaxID=2718532 RepID=UPI0014236E7A|nr:prepilin-type N-terminal cleavage/methylation domain-containing protein [Aquabacterium sp. A08]